MSNSQAYIDQHQQKFLEELFELLRIPSISTDSTKKGDIKKAADFLVSQLNYLNLSRVELFETPGNPIVYGEHCPHPDQPTVLIYGHYDVQPPDPENLWTTPPFEPTIKDGNIFARGASDDKGQAFTHIKALESFVKTDGEIPVNVKIILEGEEEIGSPNLVPFIESHTDLLKCDMVLISDTAMFGKDQPSITYGLRGLAYMEVEVVGPNRDLHSGVYGGAVENPVNVLCEMIAKMKDADGVIQIPGFYDKVVPLTEADREASEALYQTLTNAGFDVLLDDRDTRPGVKFADLELMGVPHRIVIGDRSLDNGELEYKGRRDIDATMVAEDQIVAFLGEKSGLNA